MLPDRVSNPGPLTYESCALPIALRGPAGAQQQALLACMTQSRSHCGSTSYRVTHVSDVTNKHVGCQVNKQRLHTLICASLEEERSTNMNERANTLKRNKSATLVQWEIHGALFEVLDRDNAPSNFQEMLTNSTKLCLKLLTIEKKCFPVSITPESVYVNVGYFFYVSGASIRKI